jgi:ElaB/YqjD/DUF883 family membrane-anchored ribosome-binding protein
MAMLIEHDYGSTVIAQGELVLCLKITRAAMHAQMLDDSALAEHLRSRIAERLHRVQEELRQIDDALAACSTEAVEEKEPALSSLPRIARAS